MTIICTLITKVIEQNYQIKCLKEIIKGLSLPDSHESIRRHRYCCHHRITLLSIPQHHGCHNGSMGYFQIVNCGTCGLFFGGLEALECLWMDHSQQTPQTRQTQRNRQKSLNCSHLLIDTQHHSRLQAQRSRHHTLILCLFPQTCSRSRNPRP